MGLSFRKNDISRIRHPTDVALALRHLQSKPNPTEVAAAANCLRRYIDPDSPGIDISAARDFISRGQNIITQNGLVISHDLSVAEIPRPLLLDADDTAADFVRINLEALSLEIF